MLVLVIVPFLNEERLLPTFLRSVERQTRRPDRLVLVDDGSTDGSPAIVAEFAAEHPFVTSLLRPPRPAQRDRLATAAELRAFHWGLEQVTDPFDVLVKMDADLELGPDHFESVLATMDGNPRIGLCGAHLAYRNEAGLAVRERHSPGHVRGPNKFYRRQCWEQIAPLPEILGWDGMDEVKARLHGWETQTIALPAGDSIHLRPTGTHDGALRANRRWGLCAYAVGAHPLFAMVSGVARCARRPYVLGGLNFVFGYFRAATRRVPRAESAVVRHVRREEWKRTVSALRALAPRRQGS